MMTKKQTYRFFYYWFPVLFYCFLIFIQSSLPTPKETPEVPHLDKLLHFAGYALLGALFLRGFRSSKFKNHFELIRAASILLTGIYGATDELHQQYVPYRSAEMWDVLCDFLGGFFGVYVYNLYLKRHPEIGPT